MATVACEANISRNEKSVPGFALGAGEKASSPINSPPEVFSGRRRISRVSISSDISAPKRSASASPVAVRRGMLPSTPDRADIQRSTVPRERGSAWIEAQARSEMPERASHSSVSPRMRPISTGVSPSASWMLWVMVSSRLGRGECERETLPV